MTYKKLVRKHRREFIKMAKDIKPFDYGFGLEPFIKFLEFMLEYYELGDNVHTYWYEDEGKDRDGRIDTLKEALNHYELFDSAWEGFDWGIIEEGDGWVKYEPDEKELAKVREKEKYHWNEFWAIVRDNILDWWD